MKRYGCCIVLLLGMMLSLAACGPRIISAEAAKTEGLALINQAFDAGVTEATVEYQERVGESYKNGVIVQYGTEEPRRFYAIRCGEAGDGNPLYYAEVNAVTGVAYRADKSISSIALTPQQQAQSNAIGTRDDLPIEGFEEEEQKALDLAEQWVRERFEPDVPVLSTVINSSMTDNVVFPLFYIDGFVIFYDGTIYSVEVCWPSMEVIGFQKWNQDYDRRAS